MNETSDSPEPPGEGEARRPSHFTATAVKTWADGVSAAIKTLLYAAALWLAVFAAGKLMWREESTHALRVEVGQEAQNALTSHGGDVDLSLALQDALNERLEGVHQIIAVQGLTVVGAGAEPQAVSFKPFGVEVTTDDITRLTDIIINRPPPPSVRLELLCAPATCTDAQSRPASLVMTLSAPGGTHRALYPLASGTAALRRSLRQAIQNTADLVLEQTEPGLASVWFLDHSAISGMSPTRIWQDFARAVGAAGKARQSESAGDCVADLVTGASLMQRGEFRQGFEVEQRAYGRASPQCRIHAETNVVFTAIFPSYCHGNPETRAYLQARIREVMGNLDAFGPGSAPDIVYQRITAARLDTELFALLSRDGAETLASFCSASPAPKTGTAGRFAAPLLKLMRRLQTELPVHPAGEPGHDMVIYLWGVLNAAIPRDDLEGRVTAERQLLAMILGYVETDPNPRAFDVVAGEAGLDLGDAIIAVLDRPDTEQVRLAHLFGAPDSADHDQAVSTLLYAYDNSVNAALVALENARAAAAVPLTDLPDADTLSLLGNAALMAGAPDLAGQSFRGVVEAFVLANEPVEQFPITADALARWASLRIAQGACQPGAAPDSAWAGAWQSLGAEAPDICNVAQDQLVRTQDAAKLPSLRALVRAELRRCPGPAALPGNPLDAARAWTKTVGCSDSARAKLRFMLTRTSVEKIDTELSQALATAP